MDTTRLVLQQGRLIGGIYPQRLNYLIPNFFNLEMYLKLLSHSDKQFFPLLSERTGCIVAAPVAVIPTGASVDELRILAILSAIAN